MNQEKQESVVGAFGLAFAAIMILAGYIGFEIAIVYFMEKLFGAMGFIAGLVIAMAILFGTLNAIDTSEKNDKIKEREEERQRYLDNCSYRESQLRAENRAYRERLAIQEKETSKNE